MLRDKFFSIAAETPAMENQSAADAAIRMAASDNMNYILVAQADIYIPGGLCHFAFRRLSEKQNNK